MSSSSSSSVDDAKLPPAEPTRITWELMKRKAEHHPGLLSELEEISLHQLNIEKIENIGNLAPRLKILYLQNNIIGRIENVRRLKDLVYLNLALNNLRRIENLDSCEKLRKLDLTVNFIELPELWPSLQSLEQNEQLRELYLTGNPCTQWPDYRLFVIAVMQKLEKLDGRDVTRTERMEAGNQWDRISKQYKVDCNNILEKRGNGIVEEKSDKHNDGDNDASESASVPYTPEVRRHHHLQELAREKAKEEEKRASMRSKPDDWQLAQQKLNEKVILTQEQIDSGVKPSQRNTGRFEFRLVEKREDNSTIVGSNAGHSKQSNHTPAASISHDSASSTAVLPWVEYLELHVKLPKFLDTSLIDVDLHPQWIQLIVKGKNLLLHFDDEIVVEKSSIQRVVTTGELIVKMRKLKVSGSGKLAAAAASQANGAWTRDIGGKSASGAGAKASKNEFEDDEDDVPTLEAGKSAAQRSQPASQASSSSDNSGIRAVSETRYNSSGPLESQRRQQELTAKLEKATIQDEKSNTAADDEDGPPPLEEMVRRR